jgi:hypothetical protein
MKNIHFHRSVVVLTAIVRLSSPPNVAGSEIALLDRLPRHDAEFTAQVEAAVQTLPAALRTRVANAGWQIELVRLVVDRVPALRRRKPTGWPKSSGWENADAVHLPNQKRILIATHRFDRKGKLVEANRIAAVVRHELGHAIDIVLGVNGTCYSATDAYIAAHTTDCGRIDAAKKTRLAYYTRPGSRAARQESFAELIAMQYGGGTEGPLADDLLACLPNCSELIGKLLAK